MLLAGSLVDLTSNDVPTRVINLTNDFISLKRRTDIGLCGSVPRVRYLKHRNNETTTKTYEQLQEHPEYLVEISMQVLYRTKTSTVERFTDIQDVF